jgi:hypothetical protein
MVKMDTKDDEDQQLQKSRETSAEQEEQIGDETHARYIQQEIEKHQEIFQNPNSKKTMENQDEVNSQTGNSANLSKDHLNQFSVAQEKKLLNQLFAIFNIGKLLQLILTIVIKLTSLAVIDGTSIGRKFSGKIRALLRKLLLLLRMKFLLRLAQTFLLLKKKKAYYHHHDDHEHEEHEDHEHEHNEEHSEHNHEFHEHNHDDHHDHTHQGPHAGHDFHKEHSHFHVHAHHNPLHLLSFHQGHDAHGYHEPHPPHDHHHEHHHFHMHHDHDHHVHHVDAHELVELIMRGVKYAKDIVVGGANLAWQGMNDFMNPGVSPTAGINPNIGGMHPGSNPYSNNPGYNPYYDSQNQGYSGEGSSQDLNPFTTNNSQTREQPIILYNKDRQPIVAYWPNSRKVQLLDPSKIMALNGTSPFAQSNIVNTEKGK